jgi:hypothetical protein
LTAITVSLKNLAVACKKALLAKITEFFSVSLLADEVNNQPEIEMAPNQRVLRAVVSTEQSTSLIS